jgi:CRP-like cAMP-binding protein
MPEVLKRYLSHNASIGNAELDVIARYFKPIKAKRGTLLCSQGEVCNKLYFINKGSLRVYYLSEQGQERTRFFAFEGMVATSLAGFISGEASFEFVEALEDAELLAITRADFFKLTEELTSFKDFYCRLLESAYIHNNRRLESTVTLSAMERYRQLLAQNPRVVQRVPNKIVASYLDISPETLSRLKSV